MVGRVYYQICIRLNESSGQCNSGTLVIYAMCIYFRKTIPPQRHFRVEIITTETKAKLYGFMSTKRIMVSSSRALLYFSWSVRPFACSPVHPSPLGSGLRLKALLTRCLISSFQSIRISQLKRKLLHILLNSFKI